MGARGKKRRRADGSVARSIVEKPTFKPPRLYFEGEPVLPVDPKMLLRSLEIEIRFAPIDPVAFDSLADAAPGGEDDVYRRAEDAIRADMGEEGMALDLFWRRHFLVEFLRDHAFFDANKMHFTVQPDGTVDIDPDLLQHAATTPIDACPGEKIRWP